MAEKDGRALTVEEGLSAAVAGQPQAHAAAKVRILKRLMRDPPSNPENKPFAGKEGSRTHTHAASWDDQCCLWLGAAERTSLSRRRTSGPPFPALEERGRRRLASTFVAISVRKGLH